MTYTELQTNVAAWLNREDLTAAIPTFIAFAEVMFDRQIRIREMLTRDTATADEDYEELPTDFLELKSIRFNTNPNVVPVYAAPYALENLRSRYYGTGGTPRHYTILGSQILFDRTPTGAPVLDITSYVRLPRLSGTQATNALLTNHPDIYLYATLMQAEPYLKNDERLPTWVALYEKGRDDLHTADRAAEASPSPLIMQPRKPICW